MKANINIKKVLGIAHSAAQLLLDYYDVEDLEVERKGDNSPVTVADKESSQFISEELKKIYPNIPVVSEENDKELSLNIIKKCPKFWLVDPLDGTWSFIQKKSYFTINIALVKDGKPIWGLIQSPIFKTAYYIDEKGKAVKSEGKSVVKMLSKKISKAGIDFLVSNRNLDQKLQDFISYFKVKTITPVPGAIKFALMSEGKGDIYPRFRATGLWDTAAGQALLNAVGGEVFDIKGHPLRYNGVSLNNPDFIAVTDKSFIDFSKVSLSLSNTKPYL